LNNLAPFQQRASFEIFVSPFNIENVIFVVEQISPFGFDHAGLN
jgi:hypothetical protein